MTNGFNLSSSNQSLVNSQGVGSSIVKVEEKVVMTADPAEYGGNRTITQIRTNHQITTSDRLGLHQRKGDRRDHLKLLGTGANAKRTAMGLALAAV